MRQIVLDTETTGLEVVLGHRVIEIGAVEIVNRRLTDRHFHCYLNPDRDIEIGALDVHGLTAEFLQDKPRFREVAQEFLEFVRGAELIIHNAPFDVGFLDYELRLLDLQPISLTRLLDGLSTINGARLYGPPTMDGRVPTFAFTIEGHRPDAVAATLARIGIHAWSGHFYAVEPVRRLGLLDQGGLVRVGLCHYSTVEEVDRLIGALSALG